MLFEVETKDYIKVNIDDIDVLLGAAKILRKGLSSDIRYEYDGFYRCKGKLFGRNELHSKIDIKEKHGPKLTERDEKLINTIIDIENETLSLSYSKSKER